VATAQLQEGEKQAGFCDAPDQPNSRDIGKRQISDRVRVTDHYGRVRLRERDGLPSAAFARWGSAPTASVLTRQRRPAIRMYRPSLVYSVPLTSVRHAPGGIQRPAADIGGPPSAAGSRAVPEELCGERLLAATFMTVPPSSRTSDASL
jgi:hypothetical protein